MEPRLLPDRLAAVHSLVLNIFKQQSEIVLNFQSKAKL